MNTAQQHFDVAVVGSGIIGLGAAYAAVRRGKRVIVIDASARITGASIRNFGHLCIGAQTGEARQLGEASRGIWQRLAAEAGFWLRASGTLVAARHEDEFALLEALAASSGVRLLGADEFAAATPVAREVLVGGALIEGDLQANPREAADAIAGYLASLGVEFRLRTAVTGISSRTVRTSRGKVHADRVILAVNHDVDRLLPELAESLGIVRCALDMLRVRARLRTPLDAPLLTGWSLIRYARFAGLPEAARVRERLHSTRPELAEIDLNQMYTQLPDGSLLVGDTHTKHEAPVPFQSEAAMRLLLDEARAIFGLNGPHDLDVVERWQGVYASGREEFLDREVAPGVRVVATTTGIGMTCGLGLAERAVARLYE